MINSSEKQNFMGTILSLVFGFSTASADWNRELLATDLIPFLPLLFLGMIFPRSIGISMVGVQMGSILAALFSLVRLDLKAIAVSVGVFFGSMLLQHLITIFRPGASLSVGALAGFGIDTDRRRKYLLTQSKLGVDKQ